MIDNNFNQSFFNPHSVAIVGASSNAQKTGARVQRFLVSHGYKGKIYPVNPNREEIFGFKCFFNPGYAAILILTNRAFKKLGSLEYTYTTFF